MPWPIPVLTTGPSRPGVEEHAGIVGAIAAGDVEGGVRGDAGPPRGDDRARSGWLGAR